MADSLDELYSNAQALARRSDDEAAKKAFLEILAQDPAHLGALTDLAGLALSTGYRSAALTAYSQAAECHPESPKALVNLANLLLEDGDVSEARRLYESALAIDATFAFAHQGLAKVLQSLGDEAAAKTHRDLGYKNHSIVPRPYRGTGSPPRVLLIVSARGGNIPTNIILDDRLFAATAIYAEYHDRNVPLPTHDIVFNAIGDADLCASALDEAAKIAPRSGAPLLNPPHRILDTGRAENSRRLAKIGDVVVPRVAIIPANCFKNEAAPRQLLEEGFRFPLLLRSPGFHTGQHFVRVDDSSSLCDAAARLPGTHLFVIEFFDARGMDGLSRKYRVMFIDGELYPLHLAISPSWKVHYFTSAMTENKAFRREEEKFLTDMEGVLGGSVMTALHSLNDALGLDYGGVDFGLAADGRLLLFEANATMAIMPPPPDAIWDYRRAPIERAIAAARGMLFNRAARMKETTST